MSLPFTLYDELVDEFVGKGVFAHNARFESENFLSHAGSAFHLSISGACIIAIASTVVIVCRHIVA
jgi:hypothetical protein